MKVLCFRFILMPSFSDSLETLVHIVKILHGRPCALTPRQSGVILYVPEGLHGITLGNVHENYDEFKQCVKESDCIVGPMCEFEFHSYIDILKGASYKIDVPHIVKNPQAAEKIKVMSRDKYQESIEYAQVLHKGEEPLDHESIYYRFRERYLEIFTPHFSQLIVYAENTTLEEVLDTDARLCCNRRIELLVFTKWLQESIDAPSLEVILYMCSLHYQGIDYRQVRNKVILQMYIVCQSLMVFVL